MMMNGESICEIQSFKSTSWRKGFRREGGKSAKSGVSSRGESLSLLTDSARSSSQLLTVWEKRCQMRNISVKFTFQTLMAVSRDQQVSGEERDDDIYENVDNVNEDEDEEQEEDEEDEEEEDDGILECCFCGASGHSDCQPYFYDDDESHEEVGDELQHIAKRQRQDE